MHNLNRMWHKERREGSSQSIFLSIPSPSIENHQYILLRQFFAQPCSSRHQTTMKAPAPSALRSSTKAPTPSLRKNYLYPHSPPLFPIFPPFDPYIDVNADFSSAVIPSAPVALLNGFPKAMVAQCVGRAQKSENPACSPNRNSVAYVPLFEASSFA